MHKCVGGLLRDAKRVMHAYAARDQLDGQYRRWTGGKDRRESRCDWRFDSMELKNNQHSDIYWRQKLKKINFEPFEWEFDWNWKRLLWEFGSQRPFFCLSYFWHLSTRTVDSGTCSSSEQGKKNEKRRHVPKPMRITLIKRVNKRTGCVGTIDVSGQLIVSVFTGHWTLFTVKGYESVCVDVCVLKLWRANQCLQKCQRNLKLWACFDLVGSDKRKCERMKIKRCKKMKSFAVVHVH